MDYGQKHSVERGAARLVVEEATERFGVDRVLDHVELDLAGPLAPVVADSALTDRGEAVPEGHYTLDTMRRTVVPNRNMILLALAGGLAISRGAGAVVYSPHAGDEATYPDCREAFVLQAEGLFGLCHYEPVRLYAPFLTASKADLVRWGLGHGVPYELTWSCYAPQSTRAGLRPCGRCGTCVARYEAFLIAGGQDPAEYASDPAALLVETRRGPVESLPG